MSLGEEQAKKNAELAKGTSDRVQGTCMGVDFGTGLVTVNVRGGTVQMPMVGVAPFVGDPVWVAYVGQMPLCVGSVPKSTTGTVMPTTAPTGFRYVTTDDGVLRLLVYNGAAPATGARVTIDWAANGVIQSGALSADPPGVDPAVVVVPPDEGGGGGTGGQATFQPVWSGTYYIPGGNWASTEPWVSPNQIGAFGYEGVGDTIPDGATIVERRVYVAEYSSPYPTSTTLGTHALPSRAGTPTISNGIAMANGGGWHEISAAAADALKTGAAFGLAATGGGFRKWRSAGVENSGALYLRWV